MTAEDPVVDYAAWTAPQSSSKVIYSLPLFHEIDFVVNEGYRRIPHGGLEVGGLLFGRKQKDSVQIEAFRPIDCEHSTGPSFVLSDRDIEKLQQQLRSAAQDPELQDLVPIGWFISHSRGELILSDRETELFNRFFPHPHEVTVLVKPVKFQPTRFAFLVRDAQGKLNHDGREQAIILPLPGRTSRATPSDPAPSLAAPTYQPEETAPPFHAPQPETDSKPVPPPPAEPKEKSQPEPKPEPEPQARPASEPPPAVPPPAPRPAPLPVPEPKPAAPVHTSAAMPHSLLTTAAPFKPTTPAAARSRNRGISILISAFILLLAAALGFGAGYFAYSQLSFSAISLTIEDHPPVLFVSWPASDSRDADSASIRIDDGPPRPLTLQEKAGGQAEVKMNGSSVKVELLIHNWLHESRGIVRYVRPPELPGTAGEPVAASTP